jgi:hypothetical protein
MHGIAFLLVQLLAGVSGPDISLLLLLLFCCRYQTLGCKVRSEDIHKAYQLPASPPVPIDAQYLDIYSQRVPVRTCM